MFSVYISKNFPPIGSRLLQEAGIQVEQWPHDRPMTQDELIRAVQNHQGLFCAGTDLINDFFLKSCSHLKIIAQFAVGYDNIDVATARDLGIVITNTPDAMSDATADIAFALMLAVSRKLFYLHKSIGRGDWTYFRPQAHLGMELKGKTLGIFGLGTIGLEMAKRCHAAYHMPVLYTNRNPNPLAEATVGAHHVSFDELLTRSDVLSVHCALTPETAGLFNHAVFSKMKSTALFINTSRGGVHHEGDLLDALQKGTIWGAGLDVTNPEPMTADHPLLEMENVAVLPHIGSATIEARNRMAGMAARNIIAFVRGEPVPNPVIG
ncbi:MAG: D-glycerate dehydrogenase [Lewinellaceae bacterium]|nr:D-glycerate dehydrogenase [Lewinellaceae bacterium]